MTSFTWREEWKEWRAGANIMEEVSLMEFNECDLYKYNGNWMTFLTDRLFWKFNVDLSRNYVIFDYYNSRY